MTPKNTIYVLIIFLIMFSAQQANARVYKCLDVSGKVIYKNSSCSEDEISETVINTDRPGAEYDKNYYYEFEAHPQVKKQNKMIDDVKKISSGERVNLNSYVVKNKITAFLFYADWCHSCEQIRPGIEEMARNSDKIILRKIDITKFESPVTEQYRIKSIPYFFIYDESGNLAVRGPGNPALTYLYNNI